MSTSCRHARIDRSFLSHPSLLPRRTGGEERGRSGHSFLRRRPPRVQTLRLPGQPDAGAVDLALDAVIAWARNTKHEL